MAKSAINSFFTGKSVLITGATGVCGKVLIEKILRSLLNASTIFVLVRPKKGQSATERMKSFLSTPVFTFHQYSEKQLRKIVAIEGDVTSDGLGLSSEHQNLLLSQVNVVFHVAASVRFTATFRENFTANVIGTENMLKFATRMEKLEAFVHVSTAYSNCHHWEVEEKLYDLPLDIKILLEKFRHMDEANLERESVKFFQGRPNNYTFTKALAEHVVNLYSDRLPVAIARPAVVLPAFNEPAPGFIDSVDGIIGLFLLGGLGIMQITDWNFNNHFEFIPVDYLANAIISIGWRTATIRNRKLEIYNLVVSPLNKVPEDYQLLKIGQSVWHENPSMFVVRPMRIPPRIHNMSNIEYKVKRFLYHNVLAYMLDILLVIFGRKKMMLRIVNKMHLAMDVMKFFACNQWTFKCENFKSLIQSQNEADKELFYIDVRDIDFPLLFKNSGLMARRIILKESDSTIPVARRKYKVQAVLYKVYQILLFYLFWKLLISWTFVGTIVKHLALQVVNLIPTLSTSVSKESLVL